MSQTTLTLKVAPHVPLEAELLSPDVIAPLGHDEVRALPVVLGKRQYRLEDFFEVEGAGSEELLIRGDAGRVKWIGRGMTRGRITVVGNAGMHLGAYLKGGTIEVTGHTSDWLGGEMSGPALAAADEFQVHLLLLQTAVGGLKNSIGSALIPVLQPLVDQLTDWISANRELIATKVAGNVTIGITRSTLKKIAGDLQLKFVERPFTLAEAKKAKEAFITSATSFVTPVVKIDGDKVGDGKVGATARRLREEYVRFASEGEPVT